MVRRRRTSSRVVSGHSKLAYAAAARAERSHGRPYPPLARGALSSAAVVDSAEGVAAPAAPPLKRRARGPGESVHRGRRAARSAGGQQMRVDDQREARSSTFQTQLLLASGV